jgi:hypothetical protein
MEYKHRRPGEGGNKKNKKNMLGEMTLQTKNYYNNKPQLCIVVPELSQRLTKKKEEEKKKEKRRGDVIS